MNTEPIIITTGDIESIFFEIFFKTLKKKIKSPIILISNKNLFLKQSKKFNFRGRFKIISEKNILKNNFNKNIINLVDIDLEKLKNESKISIERFYIKKSFEVATKLIRKNISKKFINGPINKKKFLNKKELGITEYIAKKFQIKDVAMLIFNKNLAVSPITTHMPIQMVSKKIKRNLIIKKIELIHNFYFTYLGTSPRIAITGLNPHCESILNSNEDDKEVQPAILNLKNQGIDVSGPFPADTVFLKDNRKKYDVIVGMYHDQVLGPFKTLFEYDAINISLGLPFIRVSPDHGPNKSMIGKNKSNPKSLINAFKFLDKF